MRPGQAAGVGSDGRHEYLRTREPGECVGCEGSGWVGLTVAEARQLARAVLAQAAAAERDCQRLQGVPPGRQQRPRSQG